MKPLYKKLYGKISSYALNLVVEHQKSLNMTRLAVLRPCTGAFQKTMGLPCAHICQQRLQNDSFLELSDFHYHWRINRLSTIPIDPDLLLQDPDTIGERQRPAARHRRRRLNLRERSRHEHVEREIAALPLPAPAQPIPARVRRSGIQGAPRRRGRAGPQLQPQEEVPAAGELMAAIARAALRQGLALAPSQASGEVQDGGIEVIDLTEG